MNSRSRFLLFLIKLTFYKIPILFEQHDYIHQSYFQLLMQSLELYTGRIISENYKMNIVQWLSCNWIFFNLENTIAYIFQKKYTQKFRKSLLRMFGLLFELFPVTGVILQVTRGYLCFYWKLGLWSFNAYVSAALNLV